MATIRKISPERRIVDAIARMPYKPAKPLRLGAPEPVTLEAVAEYLDGLLVTLAEVARDEASNEKELSQYRADDRMFARRIKRIMEFINATE